MIRLLLIVPRSKRGNIFIKSEKMSFNIPPLSPPLLAALTPKNVDVEIVDENVDEIDYKIQVNLVGISVLTMTAPRSYEIADQYRIKGIPVVLGGIRYGKQA